MTTTRAARRTARGTTLLEAVIALSILLVGLVGMLRLQVWGTAADEGARSYTQAMQLGQELASALSRLDTTDPMLKEHFTGTTAPSGFGRLIVDGGLTTGSFTPWSDSPGLPGVTLDADLLSKGVTDPADVTKVRFQRRWTVWMPDTPLVADSSKLIAVSITWRERGFPQLREVVLYGSVSNPAAVTAYLGL